MIALLSFWNSLPLLSGIRDGIGLLLVLATVALFFLDRQVKQLQTIEDEKQSSAVRMAQLEAAKANERAASLENDAAQAKLELEQIKERQKWRSLKPEQEVRILEALKEAERGAVLVGWIETADDGREYATQLHAIIEKAGGYTLPQPLYCFSMIGGPPVHGVLLDTNRVDNKVALGVQRAFESAGISAPARVIPDLKVDVSICVYSKQPKR